MIAAGFGFRKNVNFESLLEVFKTLCARHKIAQDDVRCFATHLDKAQNEALLSLSQHLNISIVAISQIEIEQQNPKTQLDLSLKHFKTGSVSEAAALAATGENSELIGCRITSRDGLATCALARGEMK